MRQPPKDVPSVIYNGIRYEAPHWSRETQAGAQRLRVISGHLEQVMRARMVAGQPIDPHDPDWLREALKDCPVSASELEAYLDLMAFQTAVAPVMMRVTQKLLSRSFPDGLPTLEGPDLRQALEDDGALTPAQIDRVVNDITGPFASSQPPVRGGRLEAFDQTSGDKLWEMEVFEDDTPAFITEIRPDGDRLLIRDDAGREHAVDLRQTPTTPGP